MKYFSPVSLFKVVKSNPLNELPKMVRLEKKSTKWIFVHIQTFYLNGLSIVLYRVQEGLVLTTVTPVGTKTCQEQTKYCLAETGNH